MKKYEWYEYIEVDFSQFIGEERCFKLSCPSCKKENYYGKYCHVCGNKLIEIENGTIKLELCDKLDLDQIGLYWIEKDNYALWNATDFKIEFEDLQLLEEKVAKRFNSKKWKEVFKALDSYKAVYKKKYFVSYEGEVR